MDGTLRRPRSTRDDTVQLSPKEEQAGCLIATSEWKNVMLMSAPQSRPIAMNHRHLALARCIGARSRTLLQHGSHRELQPCGFKREEKALLTAGKT